jgi:hypothetical protein
VRPFFKGHSAHVLVVDAQKQDDLADYLNMATDKDKNHRLLPCRVLVLGNGSAKLHEGLQRWVVGRRVHFLSCTTAYDILFDSQNASGAPAQKDTNLDSEPSKTCCSIGWNDWWNKKIDAEKTSIEKDKLRVLIASVAWLRAYKTAEMKKPADSSDRPCAFKPWLLCIGFERTHAQVAEAWGGILAEFNQHSDLIKVMVRSSPKDGSAQTVDGSYTDSILSFDDNDPKAFINTHLNELDESVRKRLIVFDNHGRCFGKKWSHEAEKACDYQDSVRYFQTFSGSTPDLYRILSRPPKSIFGFSFLIHSLVESVTLKTGQLAMISTIDLPPIRSQEFFLCSRWLQSLTRVRAARGTLHRSTSRRSRNLSKLMCVAKRELPTQFSPIKMTPQNSRY